MSARGSGLNLVRNLRNMEPDVRPYLAEDVPSAQRAGQRPPKPREARPRRRPIEPEDINDPRWNQYLQKERAYSKRVGSAKEIEDIKLKEERRGTDYESFQKGGLVKKTQVAKLHKGELVIPANRVKAVEKAIKNAGLKPIKK